MHHFLALRLADESRDRLAAIAERLRAWDLPGRWVHPEDYHLTLLFLGDCSDDDLPGIRYAAADLAGSLVQPELELVGLGAQGGRSEPQRVFAACSDRNGHCALTHQGLAAALGETPEREYRPHITLCRPQPGSASARSRPEARSWPDLLTAFGDGAWGPCPTTHLVLYRSGPGSPRYEALTSWPLIAVGKS